MPLSDRLKNKKGQIFSSSKSGTGQNDKRRGILQEIKIRMHRSLIDKMNLDALLHLDQEEARKQVSSVLRSIFEEEKVPITAEERELVIREVCDETFGLGPLEPLLADPTIDEILVNGADQVYVERAGKLETVETTFKDNEHLKNIITRIVARIGRRIDESSPMADARLADGSRVNAVIPPLAIDGPTLSIRRFKKIPFSAKELVTRKSMTEQMVGILELAVNSKLNILISGGTGTGKTTMLNVLSSFIPSDERIITIEDAAELQLQQEHVVRLETRPSNLEGRGQVTQRDLLKNALRMRPDRIVVGEVRGEEALDMLQAMNTGHEGSLTTVHANTARDAIARLETMVLMANSNLTQNAIIRQIASAFHLILQIKRYSDGKRRVDSLSELTGLEGETILLQELFAFEQKGKGPDGKILGDFVFRNVRPKFINIAEKNNRVA